MRKYIIYLLVLYLVTGCTEDKGNYQYAVLNTIKIDGFAADTTFRVDQYDTLKINPVLHFESGAPTDLSYEWKIDHKIVSTDPVCRVEVSDKPKAGNGYYTAGLCVTDNATNLKYYKDFKVVVGTPFTNALYILSEQSEERSMLSFQRRDKPDAPLVHNVFENANPDFGHLGKKPRQVFNQTFPTTMFGVLSAEGDKKMVLLDPSFMEMTQYYTEEVIRGGYKGEFKPEKISLYMGGMIVSGGKIFGYNYMRNKAIYRPIAGDYEFASWIDTHESFDSYVWVSYDNKGERFVSLKPGNDVLAYDIVTPLTIKNQSTSGQKFFAAGSEKAGSMDVKKHIMLYDKSTNKAHFYTITVGFSFFTFEGDVTASAKTMEKENLIDEHSVCIFSKSLYWYIANNNVIKRLHRDGGEPAVWFTAPKGNVIAMMTDETKDAADKRLFIATYDGTKSYIYVIDILTKALLEEPMEVDGKIVSMVLKGKWTY